MHRKARSTICGGGLNYNVVVDDTIGFLDGCRILTTKNGRVLERRSLRRQPRQVVGWSEYLEGGADREDGNDRGLGWCGPEMASGYAGIDPEWCSMEGRAR